MVDSTGIIPYTKATEIASVYASATANIERLAKELGTEFAKLDQAFAFETSTYGAFKCKIQYGPQYYNGVECDTNGIARLMTHFKRSAWRVLVEKLQITKLMCDRRRDLLNAQLNGERGPDGNAPAPLPEIDEHSIMDVLRGFIADAPSFIEESIREVYQWLIPHRDYGAGRYKTNQKDRVGKRVIVQHIAENWMGSISLNCRMIGKLAALDSVFHSLDGRGIVAGQNGPLVDAMRLSTETGKGETDLFRFSLHKNGNGHIEFLRQDLLDLFNLVAADGKSLGDRTSR